MWANADGLAPEFRVGLALFYCVPTPLSSAVAIAREVGVTASSRRSRDLA